jgi:dolichyl-phosphate-mannose-protein mannosyltransferase
MATFGAALVLLDNALLVESRFTLMDSMLLLFGVSAVTVALAARGRTGRASTALLTASAVLAGCAAATKLTGLTALALVGVIWLAEIVRQRPAWRTVLGQAAILAVVPFVVYAGAFAVHFSMLHQSGKAANGANYDAYMSQKFQSTLKGDPLYRPDVHLSYWEKFTELNGVMQRSQTSLDSGSHPYASKWTSWPIMKRGVYLYLGPAGNGKARYIYTLGNPIVWWGVILGALAILIGAAVRPKRFAPMRWPLAFLGFAWLVNYLPFALIHRPMFLYHYFYGLVYSIAFVAIGLGALTGWSDEGEQPWTFGSKRSAVAYWGLLGAALLGFLYFAPITYGIPLSPEGLDARMWLHSWR